MTNTELMELLSSIMDGSIVLDEHGKPILTIESGAYSSDTGQFYSTEDYQQGRIPTDGVRWAVKLKTK